tara:strand:- start:622 stop:1956 length:1335 start_codon:yes stop_codon:yes gene_type:complete
MSEALPQDLNFSLRPVSASARQYLQNLPPTNGSSFQPSNVIRVSIPCGRPNTFYQPHQSYLKLKLTNNHADALTVDNSVHSLIQRLTIYHGSNLIEDINDYGVIASMLYDLQVDGAELGRTGAITSGGQDGQTFASNDISTSRNINRRGATVAGTADRVFAFPLISGVVGTMMSKALPVGEMSAGDLRIEIELASASLAVVNNTTNNNAPDWTVSDVEYVCSFIELSAQASQDIRNAHGGRYAISTESYRSYQATVNAGAGEQTFLIPAKFSSLKSLVCSMRSSTTTAVDNAGYKSSSTSGRAKGEMSQYQFRLSGGLSLPSQPVDCEDNAQVIAELMRCFHALGVANHSTNLDPTQFDLVGTAQSAGAVPHDDKHGSFMFAINLDAYGANSHLLEQGTDTLGSGNIFLNATFGSGNLAGQLNSFAHYDLLLAVDENGVMSAKY